MTPAADSDPRPLVEPDMRPLVARSRSGLPAWIGLVLILLAGFGLFAVLDARRRAASAPSVRLRDAPRLAEAAPPPLVIPPAPAAAPVPAPPPDLISRRPLPPPPPRIVYMPSPPMRQQPEFVPPTPVPPPAAAGGAPPSALVVDLTSADASPTPAASPTAGAAAAAGATSALSPTASARATVLRRRATVVPQGTLIPAVLETALDSTRPGPARALVTADVRGFDGSRVLIPRGSRLVGDYRADLRPGQNRALIIWSRLTRPDGAIIALASPAADQVGRAGVRGDVDSHFFERFGAAILQSSLNVGVALASRIGSGDSIAVLGLPGTLGATGTAIDNQTVQPTLRVRQGTATAVFVTRDLDFTGVERAR